MTKNIKLGKKLLKSKLIITTFHEKEFYKFYKNLELVLQKYRLHLSFDKKIKTKKMTILRSPHVNKSARDQIELKSIKNYFILNDNRLINFFLFIYFKIAKISFNLLYKKVKEQKIVLIIKNEKTF